MKNEVSLKFKRVRNWWAVVMAACVIGSPVKAGDFDYSINVDTNTVTITAYNGSGGDVAIPASIDGLMVTCIGDMAFEDCKNLTSLEIPGGVVSIGQAAFQGCDGLCNVALPPGLTGIGQGAFFGCTSLTNVAIPVGDSNIDKATFFNCTDLKGVTIPEGVTNIGDMAFTYCSALKNVTIPSSVARIGDWAFAYCPELNGLYFQGNPPSLGLAVFFDNNNAVIYYLSGKSGWGRTFGSRPTSVMFPLVVRSDFEIPNPPAGTNWFHNSATVTASVGAMVSNGTTQYVCTGWSGTGSVPASGTSNSVSFVITNDTTLTWNWLTRFWLTAGVSGQGSVNVSNGWHAAGEIVDITVTPGADHVFAGWTGNLTSSANPLHLTMNRAYTITAVIQPTVAYVDGGYCSTNAGGHVFGDNAFNTIQDAIDAVRADGTVWVAAGVYNQGSTSVSGMPTRVALTKPVTVRSVSGAAWTIIEGAADPATNGPAAIRCAYVGAGASLIGFTLMDGHTMQIPSGSYDSSWDYLACGGGVLAEAGGMVWNCVIEGNTASYCGGGAVIKNPGTTLRDCVADRNAASYGGGVLAVDSSVIENCTLSDNAGSIAGGGLKTDGAIVRNTLIWGNRSPDEATADYYRSYGVFERCCTKLPTSGSGNITNAPMFVNAEHGDYRLLPDSPCIDAGTNMDWMTDSLVTLELVDLPRLYDGNKTGTATVDIGAHEYCGWAMAIKANGVRNDLTIRSTDTLSITVEGDPSLYEGFPHDWWIAAQTPWGELYSFQAATSNWTPGLTVAYQGPLFKLPTTEVLSTSNLPAGEYYFYFAVDWLMDGLLEFEALTLDMLVVHVTVRP